VGVLLDGPRRTMRLLPALFVVFALPAAAAERVDFNRDIRPIISGKCFACHGPDEESREADLRLDVRAEALKERDGVRAIVPGDLKASELLLRVTSTDRDEVMPPPKEGHPLEPKEVALLKQWIEQGAEYQSHWSFIKPEQKEPPQIANRNVSIRNPIDAFVVEKLASTELRQAPEADRHTLIRRLSFDLIGLPPTPAEVDAFVADNDPRAYEKLVDRLLASPSFGERWAKMWLDLARYADSTGYGSDKFRLNIWPYRDWVINAFNRNLPYDQFTIEQLAGDLLPNPTRDQLAATAFHRNTMTNVEGGTIDEEWRVAAVKDRIATTGQVWMGLTVGCAQCHTHKFDPISHREYYQLFAVFDQTEDSDREDEEPTMPLPTPEQTAEQERLHGEIAALENKLKASSAELESEQHEWEAHMARPMHWQVLAPIETKTESAVKLEPQADGSLLAQGAEAAVDTYTVRTSGIPRATAVRLELLTDDSLPGKGPGRADHGNAVLTDLRLGVAAADHRPVRGRFVRIELPGDGRMLSLAEVQVHQGTTNLAAPGTATQSSTDFNGPPQLAIDGNTDGNFSKSSVTHTRTEKDPWWEVDLGAEQEIDAITVWNRTDQGVEDRLANFKVRVLGNDREARWEKTNTPAPKKSVRIGVPGEKEIALQNASADFAQPDFAVGAALDADPKTGWALNPELGKPHAAVFELKQPATLQADETFVFTLKQTYGQKHTIGRFRLSATTAPLPVRELPEKIRAVLALEPSERTAAQRAEIAAYFLPLSKHFAELNQQIAAKKAQLAKIKPVKLPIARELPAAKRRVTHLMNKGNYLAPAERVEPGLLAAFASAIPQDRPIDRLATAQWLLSPENPLTARVAVNRFWAQIFGLGLVETEEDFGSQGTLPSHPELLDWLAVTFQSAKPAGLGWDMKALLKLIVSSATYRQSSKISPEMVQNDPRNRLLARYPRARLDAEGVRDQALALGGLLSGKIGGPSVYPVQPANLWNVAFNGGENAYPTSRGEDRYRRGVYTFWRRTMPYPSMTTFDAPSRESCTVRRTATNTPLQAFVTLNDPVYFECAQALARRIVREGGSDTAARLRFGLQLALARPGQEEQVAALQRLFEAEQAYYQSDLQAAGKLIGEAAPAGSTDAELAAWTVVSNVLLNLDGVLTKN
jgi:hypothetical protein